MKSISRLVFLILAVLFHPFASEGGAISSVPSSLCDDLDETLLTAQEWEGRLEDASQTKQGIPELFRDLGRKELHGFYDNKHCHDEGVLVSKGILFDRQVLIVRTRKDACDGGNSYGVVLQGKGKELVLDALVIDSYIYCLPGNRREKIDRPSNF